MQVELAFASGRNIYYFVWPQKKNACMLLQDLIPFELSTGESALVRGGFFRRSRENKGKTNMKQLKFMLAAATAIGLATAAQADGVKETKTVNNENFDGVVLEDGQYARDLPGYSYSDPGNLADDESTISTAAEGYNGTKSLKVNTGTNALLRAMMASGDTAIPITLTAEKSVYIDTMVQFTVTPAGDTVTNGDDDKLMIYLAEATNETGVVTGTNLMVKAGKHVQTQSGRDKIDSFEPLDVAVSASGITVAPNVWYRLKVTSYVVGSITLFTATLDGVDLVAETQMYLLDTENKIFPSMVYGTDDSATLTYVGFAGEGMVDNLTVATLEPQTSVDFTFTWTTDGISAVTYTVGDKSGTVNSGTAIADLDPGATITIAVTPADWYALVDDPVLSYQVLTTTGQTQSLDDLVKKVTQKTDAQGNVVLNPDATVGEVQEAASINGGYFSGSTVTKDELTAVLNWKSKKGGSDYDINKITFAAAGDPETDDAKAYLLDCTKADLATEIQKFVFTGFDPENGGSFAVGTGKNVANGAKYGNGKVEVRGATALDDTDAFKAAKKEGDKFFKAFLVK